MGEANTDRDFRLEAKPAESTKSMREGITRRDALKGLAGVGLLMALGRLLRDKTESNSQKTQKEKPAEIVDNGRDASLKELIEAQKTPVAFNEVFHDLASSDWKVARDIVEKMKNEVLYPNPSFEGMLAVTNTFQVQIREAARQYNIPENIVLGMVFIENGGAPDLTSSEGARGPAQLLETTAREVGLRVDEKVDERLDPDKCFRGMGEYLSRLRNKYGGDLGIAVWGYHAGYGNVYNALRTYFLDTTGVDLGEAVSDSAEEAQRAVENYRSKISQTNLNVHRLLENNAVKQQVLVNLKDESPLYPYKAVAAAEIFAEAQAKGLASKSLEGR